MTDAIETLRYTHLVDAQTVSLTLRLAALTTVILLLGGVPLACWLAQGQSWPRSVVQTLVTLPLVLPPTVLGFYLLVLLGPMTAPGRWLIRLLGHPLAFSFSGLVLGSVLYSLPFVVQPVTAGLRAVSLEQQEAAAGLGASPWRVLTTVSLPSAANSILAGALLAFLHTIGEFGVVLMLGGNIPGATRTLSIALYDLVEESRYAEANRTAAVLLVVALISLLTLSLLGGRRSRGPLAS